MTFDVVYERRVKEMLWSLLSVDTGGGWTSGVWQVWATASDGKRFLVKELLDDGTARYTVEAFEGQLREIDPVEWARSKGCDALADHLRQLSE